MVPCPKGAIINHEELEAFESALKEAIESMQCWVNSETRPNKGTHDETYKQIVQIHCEQILVWRKHLHSVRRVRKAKNRG